MLSVFLNYFTWTLSSKFAVSSCCVPTTSYACLFTTSNVSKEVHVLWLMIQSGRCCLAGTAPQYLQELCIPVTASTSRRHLCSAARGDLQMLACRTSSFGPRSFAACAPKLWNSLPLSLRDPTLSLTLFCSRLKTHLLGLAYGRSLVTA